MHRMLRAELRHIDNRDTLRITWKAIDIPEYFFDQAALGQVPPSCMSQHDLASMRKAQC